MWYRKRAIASMGRKMKLLSCISQLPHYWIWKEIIVYTKYSGAGHLAALWWTHWFLSDLVLSSLTPEDVPSVATGDDTVPWGCGLLCQDQPQDGFLSDSRGRWQPPLCSSVAARPSGDPTNAAPSIGLRVVSYGFSARQATCKVLLESKTVKMGQRQHFKMSLLFPTVGMSQTAGK